MVLKQRMHTAKITWRWVSSERQSADGLTKLSARHLLADRLRAAMLGLKHDPNFVAAEKKDIQDRHKESRQDAAYRKDVSARSRCTHGLARPASVGPYR